MSQGDVILRALTQDGAFRLIAGRTTESAAGITLAQRTTGPTTRRLAELVTATLLFRETMSPNLRVQALLTEGAMRLIADCNPSGASRGLVQTLGSPVDRGELRVMRSLATGALQQGVVAFRPGTSISQAFIGAMQTSEQVPTMTSVAAEVQADRVTAAGGYMLQLLPEAERGRVLVMEERLNDFRSVEGLVKPNFSVETLIAELFYGMEYTVTSEAAVRCECWCSTAALLSALSTLDRPELLSLIDDEKPLEITCDYCRRDYRLSPAELRRMLDAN